MQGQYSGVSPAEVSLSQPCSLVHGANPGGVTMGTGSGSLQLGWGAVGWDVV